MTSPKTLARTAGLLYLMVSVSGIVALVVLSRVIKSGDAAATADNIRSSATLFRVGIVSELVAATCWLFTAMALYLLLRHVQRQAAAAMVTFVAIGLAIVCVGLAGQYTALTIATGEGYSRALGEAGADALTLLHTDGRAPVAAMFTGLWLLPLGYLVVRSGYFPRLLGVLLMVGCFGYLANLFTQLLAPDLAERTVLFFTVPAVLTELVFLVWLLAKGVRVPAAVQPRPPVLAESGHSS